MNELFHLTKFQLNRIKNNVEVCIVGTSSRKFSNKSKIQLINASKIFSDFQQTSKNFYNRFSLDFKKVFV